MGSKVRIGILGAGWMGAEQAAAYADMQHVEVAGVFHATRIARVLWNRTGYGCGGMIGSDAINAIDVCLLSATHHRLRPGGRLGVGVRLRLERNYSE